ncbi:hypothetical protein [Cupriavidus neocaledonicus]|uniref:Uncharacterized protein n=1 Tax=Cupriavidus neocaledonicus TaxID=1040979 RepID=A0A375HT93_9BURK|nr:hypothetical protein [Cupriavidus neocaledonicus]SOZ38384.1 conserved hypothetical protein; putative exported protein [Cupriavidus neocaledonicus]SPD59977.1 conserved protein of unknown function [Cupriavidus neocaledonicus]
MPPAPAAVHASPTPARCRWRGAAVRLGVSWLAMALAVPATQAATAAMPPPLSELATLLLGTVRGKPTGMRGVTRLTTGDADRQLRLACQELMRAGPVDLDDTTRFDGCVARPGKIVDFHLKVSGIDASRDDTRDFMATAKPILERGICRNPDVPVLGKLGIRLRYHYAAGPKPLVLLDIPPDQCRGK